MAASVSNLAGAGNTIAATLRPYLRSSVWIGAPESTSIKVIKWGVVAKIFPAKKLQVKRIAFGATQIHFLDDL